MISTPARRSIHRLLADSGLSRASLTQFPERVPVAGVLRGSDPPGGAALRAAAVADRAEPPQRPGRRHRQRGRVRPGLVRAQRHTGPVPQLAAGVGRPEPARAQRADPLAAVPRPRPRRQCGHAGAADELPPVQAREVAVRAQRLHRRLAAPAARADDGGGPGALPAHRGLDGLRGDVLPRADLRPGRRPARRPRADGRLRRGGRAPARQRAPAADDRRAQRRRAGRSRCATRAARRSTRCSSARRCTTSGCSCLRRSGSGTSPTRRGWWCPSP